jgi:alpha-L-fucosidase
VKEKGLKMGFYYSLYEWFNPLYKTNVAKYVDDQMIPQLQDLVVRYHPDIVWTDGEWSHPDETWKSTRFLSWLYNDSPVKDQVVVNDRWGKGTRGKHGGFYTTEYDISHVEDKSVYHPWEECRGIGGSFGYNRNENLQDYQSSASLIHVLVEKVARGGNLLLNVGPTADGRIPVIMQQRLSDIGAWLKVNGESIYRTRRWNDAPDIKAPTTHYFTRKGSDLYLIITQWQDKPIVVDKIEHVDDVSMLGYAGKIKYKHNGRKLTITLPAINPANNPCEFAWVFKIKQALN